MASTEASTRRRVKLYMLNDDRQWDDKGTGHVSALYTEQNNMALVVVSETDGSCLLESKIQSDTAYQKQQETLIVWSEGENMDLALSFQEKVGCYDIWVKICNAQGKDPSLDITQEVADEPDDADDVEGYVPSTGQSSQNFDLPPCELDRLEELAELVSQASQYQAKRERLAAALERNNYMRQLVDLFNRAEDLEDMESLHHLYEIVRQTILFNRPKLCEILFADDMLLDIIGILEYSPTGRTRHRDFLRNQANFREVLPLHKPELINRIHQTYRVQYIQECCLPPPCLFDEHALSVLKSFVSLNKFEIISALQDDEDFMLRLFSQLKDVKTDDAHRRELALFVKEFCNISVQTDQRDNFLNCLFHHGALSAVEVLLNFDDRDVKGAALEILQAFVEHQPSVVREYVYKDTPPLRNDDEILINIMIAQLLNDPDPELSDAFLLSYMLRVLVDPDNMTTTSVRGEKVEFLSFFYKRCISTLTRPLFNNTAGVTPANDDYHTALVLSNVLELLTFCIENHTHHMKSYCFNQNLVKHVLVLLCSSHKFLVLGALRLLRRVLNMKEDFYIRYLIRNNLFKPVVDLFVGNGHRYNLIDSAIIEFFDFIRLTESTVLINYVVDNFWDRLKDVTYVQTFTELKTYYDQGSHALRMPSQPSQSHVLSLVTAASSRYQRDARAMEEEEELWFDQDEEEEEEEDDAMATANLNQDSSAFSAAQRSPSQVALEGDSTVSPNNIVSTTSARPAATVSYSFLDTTRNSVLSMPSVTTSVNPSSERLPSLPTNSEKCSISDRPMPSSNLMSFIERSTAVDSDESGNLLVRPGLVRQSTPIAINIKSTTLSNGLGVASKLTSVKVGSRSPNVDDDAFAARSPTELILSADQISANAVELAPLSLFDHMKRSGDELTVSTTNKRTFKRMRSTNKDPIQTHVPDLSLEEKDTTVLQNFILSQSAASFLDTADHEETKADAMQPVGLVDYSDEESDDETCTSSDGVGSDDSSQNSGDAPKPSPLSVSDLPTKSPSSENDKTVSQENCTLTTSPAKLES